MSLASLDFQLPLLDVLESTIAKVSTKKRSLNDYTSDNLELKVVTNTLFLLSETDSHIESCRKLADCLADATGMFVRSEALGI